MSEKEDIENIEDIIKKAYKENPDKLSPILNLMFYCYACCYNDIDPNIDKDISDDLEKMMKKIEEKISKKEPLDTEEIQIYLVTKEEQEPQIEEPRMEKFFRGINNNLSILYASFEDWYEICDTLNQEIRNFVLREYPVDKYPNVLCVGDGKKCHLGRKLAMEGYRVVSIDPAADKSFSCDEIKGKKGKSGSIYVTTKYFSEESKDLIDWADIIVGNKVPMLAEVLLKMPKPVIFNVSYNSQIHGIKFNGVDIESGAHLQNLIKASKGVHTYEGLPSLRWDNNYSRLIFQVDRKRDKERAKEIEQGLGYYD